MFRSLRWTENSEFPCHANLWSAASTSVTADWTAARLLAPAGQQKRTNPLFQMSREKCYCRCCCWRASDEWMNGGERGFKHSTQGLEIGCRCICKVPALASLDLGADPAGSASELRVRSDSVAYFMASLFFFSSQLTAGYLQNRRTGPELRRGEEHPSRTYRRNSQTHHATLPLLSVTLRH